MKQQLPGHSAWLHALRQSKAVRQTTALFVKNVLVAWRNRWSTGIRLLAPLLFLALALVVQEALGANARRTGRIRDTPVSLPVQTSSIPNCHSELFIHDKPCLDFIYTPNNDTTVKAIVEAIQQHNDPPIPDARVLGFSSRADADRFIQQRKAFVLGGVHFSYGVSDRLQYIVQSNTTVPTFKGYVQSPNNFFQMPFISAIAREVSRYYLQQAGRHSEAVNLQWQPSMVPFPHPKLSAGTAGYILPPFIFVACMFATISTLGMLVSEKESGLRQALQTMGLLQGSYWLSWWLFEAVMAAIVAWCIIGFGAALQLRMFTTNSVWLLFLLFWLFGMAMSSFACCVSVFLSSSQSASNAGLAIVLAGWVCQALAALGVPYAPNILYTPNGMGKVFLWIFMLFPWNPLTKGVLDMSAAANSSLHPGLKFAQRSSYCRYVPHPSKAAAGSMSWLYLEDNCIFSIQQCFITLLIQAIAWMVAAVYLDNVQPNKHGVRLPLWYPLLPGYWGNLFKAATSYWNQQGSFTGPSAAAASAKFRTKSPFAATEVNRKVARSITDAKEGELVIRCSSSPGIPAEQHKGFMASVGQNSTIHRHSVSSGLRRRETRQSSAAGDPMPSVDLGNRAVVQSTMGKLPNFPQHSTQLLVQNSVTVLRLSDGSSEAASTAGVAQTIGPGQTMTLQQYQQMQQQPKPSSMSDKKWWEFWRVPESSMALAAKKHGSLVAAAAVTGPGSVSDKDVGAVTYGMVPVVLDPGVLQEEQRMKAAWYTDSDGPWTSRHDMVQVFGLRKVYKMPASTKKRRWWPPCGSSRKQQQLQAVCQQQQRLQHFVAVADSWFGVPKGQLLCLLGPNGAGKTTSINCLIGALPPTGGDIRVMGQSLLAPGGLEVAQSVMGVCPQFDVLWDELSGSEHMYIYGCIKGLQSAEVKEEGARLLEQVQLTFAAKKRSSSYSGGMKRRLSVALALLGRPSLVYLDEPSTGMDPISRRAVWDAINAAKQHAAVVLTTHSMEEADALGDRIGIMVRGRMRVLGGSLTLKQKYGNGYQLKLRLKDSHVVEQLLPHTCQHLTIQAASTADVSCGPSSTPMDGIQPAVPQPGHSSAARIIGSPASARSAASGHAPVNQGSSVLQELVAEHLGLAPTEEGRQMLHYVIPQALAPQLQVLLEMLDDPEQQQQLGLAEVHVSLATLEEVFLTVVKQAEQDHAALHGHTVMVELPETGQQLEVPVGQEAAVEPATGDVYAVEWVQDEWGKLAVLGVRLMEQAEQQRYWQNRHVQQ